MSPARFPVLLLSFVLIGVMAAPVVAQQEFVLDEDDQWMLSEAVEPGSPEAQLLVAQQALAGRRFLRAESLATRWIERHDRHPLLPEAYLVRGDALFGRKEHYRALFDYEYIARVHPESEAFVVALERELDIARLFATGTRRKIWGLRIADASDEAAELMIRTQERLPGSRLGEQASIELGDFYFARSQMELAADAYDLFTQNYPRSEYRLKAKRRLVYANLARFKGPAFDASGLYEARDKLYELKATDPLVADELGADELLIRINESDAAKMLATARWYLKRDDAIGAEYLVRRLVHRYPRTAAAMEGMRFGLELWDRLPPGVQATAPEYGALLADAQADPATMPLIRPSNPPVRPVKPPVAPTTPEAGATTAPQPDSASGAGPETSP